MGEAAAGLDLVGNICSVFGLIVVSGGLSHIECRAALLTASGLDTYPTQDTCIFRKGQRMFLSFKTLRTAILVGSVAVLSSCNTKLESPNGPVPTPEDLTPESNFNTPPEVNLASLESANSDPQDRKYWDSVLTIAELCSRIYQPGENQFEELGFSSCEIIESGSHYAAVCSNDKVVVVVFRGTSIPIPDWLTNLTFVNHEIDAQSGFVVHRGFFNATESIYSRVLSSLRAQGGGTKRVIVTGHSLGGAMAAIFSLKARTKEGMTIDEVVTFGQPLAFNVALGDHINDTFKQSYRRFVNADDIVPRVLRGYLHAGCRIQFINGKALCWKPMVLSRAPHNGGEEIPEDQSKYSCHDQELDEQLLDEHELKRRVNAEKVRVSNVSSPLLSWDAEPWIIGQHSMQQYIQKIQRISTASQVVDENESFW